MNGQTFVLLFSTFLFLGGFLKLAFENINLRADLKAEREMFLQLQKHLSEAITDKKALQDLYNIERKHVTDLLLDEKKEPGY